MPMEVYDYLDNKCVTDSEIVSVLYELSINKSPDFIGICNIYMVYIYIYELHSNVDCYPKIKLSPRVLSFCYILCCV